MGCAESRFLILQYPHKIFAITVKLDAEAKPWFASGRYCGVPSLSPRPMWSYHCERFAASRDERDVRAAERLQLATSARRSTRGHRRPFYGIKCTSYAKPEIQTRPRGQTTDFSVGLQKARNGPGQLIKQTRNCRLRCLYSHAFARFPSSDKVRNIDVAYKPRRERAIFRSFFFRKYQWMLALDKKKRKNFKNNLR